MFVDLLIHTNQFVDRFKDYLINKGFYPTKVRIPDHGCHWFHVKPAGRLHCSVPRAIRWIGGLNTSSRWMIQCAILVRPPRGPDVWISALAVKTAVHRHIWSWSGGQQSRDGAAFAQQVCRASRSSIRWRSKARWGHLDADAQQGGSSATASLFSGSWSRCWSISTCSSGSSRTRAKHKSYQLFLYVIFLLQTLSA